MDDTYEYALPYCPAARLRVRDPIAGNRIWGAKEAAASIAYRIDWGETAGLLGSCRQLVAQLRVNRCAVHGSAVRGTCWKGHLTDYYIYISVYVDEGITREQQSREESVATTERRIRRTWRMVDGRDVSRFAAPITTASKRNEESEAPREGSRRVIESRILSWGGGGSPTGSKASPLSLSLCVCLSFAVWIMSHVSVSVSCESGRGGQGAGWGDLSEM